MACAQPVCEPAHDVAIARFLAQFPGQTRAEAVHLALKALRSRVEPDRVLACELAWEVHIRGYWSQIREDGRPYESEEDYFRTVLGLTSWRTAYKRLAIGRMLSAFPERERAAVRAAIAEVGLAKASAVVPAIEQTGQWQMFLEWARTMAYPSLQARVSEVLQAVPRGREPSPPGERFRRAVLSAMADIEAMELVERFFEIGQRVVGTKHPIAIFLAGCRECLAEWEVQVRYKRRHREGQSAGEGQQPKGQTSPGQDQFCPRGQTAPSPADGLSP